MKSWMLVTFIAMLSSGGASGSWTGFHGLEKEGHCGLSDVPLTWSASENVVWKTVIPGRGHSSPIVSGNAVYVTTTYESFRLNTSRNVWKWSIFVLVLLLTVAAAVNATQHLACLYSKGEQFWLHVRLFLFSQMLVGIAVVVFFGCHLLNPGEDAVQYLWLSIMLSQTCLTLAILFISLVSRWQLVASALSFAVAVAAFIVLRYRGLALSTGSLKETVTVAFLAVPVMFGLALLLAHLHARRRYRTTCGRSETERGRLILWRFAATAVMGFVTVVILFGLLVFRAADYQVPDSYVWGTRVRPDIGWRWAGVYVGVVLTTLAICRWRLSLGRVTHSLLSGPGQFVAAVALGAVYFGGINAPEKPKEFVRAVVCLDRDNGKIQWTCEGLRVPPRADSRVVTHASATPATDGPRIYGYFGQDGLICVSPEGELLWRRAEPMFRCKFGVGTSPVIRDDLLIIASDVMASGALSSSLTAFESTSGKPVWRKTRESHDAYATYSTPLIRSMNGRDVVIVHGWYDIKGYDLTTGQEMWSYSMEHGGKHLVASLVCDEDRVYVTGAKRIVALNLSMLASGGEPLVWSRPIPGEKSSTPVAADGLFFLVTEPGVAYCLESRTGEIAWKERLDGRFFSSVLLAGDKVFFTSESGKTTIVAADRQFRVLAKNDLGESIYASLAPAGDRLFVRTAKHLYCIGEPKR